MLRTHGWHRIRWILLFAAGWCGISLSAAADKPLPEVEILRTPEGQRYGLWSPRPDRPRPTLFVFAGSLEDSLTKTAYCEIGQRLLDKDFLCVSLDLPCHGEDGRNDEPHDLSGWRQRVDRGEPLAADFVARARAVLDDLIRQGFTNESQVAACGTSRGGFMALHWAAADPRVRAVAAFAPVTGLLALSEFAGSADTKPARDLALTEQADALSRRHVWITIGDQDRRVGTDRSVRLADRIHEFVAARRRPDRCTIEVLPAEGHRTPAGAHARAADWLLTAVADKSAAAQTPELRKRVLIVTGHQHPAHDWSAVTPALLRALARDPDLQATASDNPEVLADPRLSDYDAIVFNYCNWERPGLSERAQQNLQKYLAGGGGLVIIHFANGAFHFSLPGAEKSDWPEWRTKICRRVWDHTAGKSGHDPFGKFRVDVAASDHPILRGLESFETVDELYFNQQGTEPIEVLATARSKVTGKDEPMAFVYRYGQGRVFQTVLGHAAESIEVPSVAELIARGAQSVAGGTPRTGPVVASPSGNAQSRAAERNEPLQPGRFGQALNAARHFALAEPRPKYAQGPLTVECWAQLDNARGFNILVAQQPKESADHWELYSYAGSGELSLYLPGYDPSDIRSSVNVADGQWHYLAAQWDGQNAKLFVDGNLVRETPLVRARDDLRPGPLWIGAYPPQMIGCAGQIDAVRLSQGLRPIGASPTAPFTADEQTVGLWQFDEFANHAFADASTLANPAQLDARWLPPTEPLVYQAADPRLRVVTIDRSPDESFLSLRLDTTGRLFAGGREALFVYEPAADGGYQPRHELFRFPPHTWITDIEIRGDDVYVTTASALYVLPGARTRRQQIAATRLIWGLPLDLHVTMHGLAWGPEGDLYFAAGDPLLNYGDFQRPDHWGHWTLFGPQGEKTPYTGSGGVFRCRPDGTRLQVVARGLRGCDGLAFDRSWNLFTNDNDHESLAASYSPARLLHVTPEADFQWPRGWMPEKSPDRRDLLELVNANMLRGVPVGQAYYDEPLLPAELRHNLLVARWDNRSVSRYPLTARGASFSAVEQTLLEGENTARPVGVAVGRGGRIFVAVSNMQGNEGSPTYASELAMLVPVDETDAHPFAGYEVTALGVDALYDELSSSSWSRRSAAHGELLRRGKPALAGALARATKLSDPTANAAHLPWLIGALETDAAFDTLRQLAGSSDARVRLQAIRALGEFGSASTPEAYFVARLDDRDPQVQLAALVALFRYSGNPPGRVANGPARSADSYLRQTSATLLARRGNVELFECLCGHSETLTRLAGVLAAGFRLTVPQATGSLPDELPLRYEHGNASFVIQYADATVDLKQLGRVGSFTIAERWATLPHAADEQRLFELLVDRCSDPERTVALQAAWFLNLLNDATAAPLVEQTRERVEMQRLLAAAATSIDQAWSVGPFSNLPEQPAAAHPPESGAIDLSANYADGAARLAWRKLKAQPAVGFALTRLAPPAVATNYLFFRLQTAQPQRILLEAPPGNNLAIWHNGLKLANPAPCRLDLQPGSNDLLVRIDAKAESPHVRLSYRAAEPVVAVLPEPLGMANLAARLRESAGSAAAPLGREFTDVDWPAAAAVGDAARGRKLFGADALGCVKCHAIAPAQTVAGGPSLSGARNRFTVAHLVESILTPSRQVAPVFRASTIITSDGKIHTGLVLSEDKLRLELLQPDATRIQLAKGLIDERGWQEPSPMPAGLVKTPDELRDLLAYLLSENPQAP